MVCARLRCAVVLKDQALRVSVSEESFPIDRAHPLNAHGLVQDSSDTLGSSGARVLSPVGDECILHGPYDPPGGTCEAGPIRLRALLPAIAGTEDGGMTPSEQVWH